MKPEKQSSKPQVASTLPAGTDGLTELMQHFGVPLTPENYLALNFLGEEPTPEQLSELPPELQPQHPRSSAGSVKAKL